jgi:hypothetical protein
MQLELDFASPPPADKRPAPLQQRTPAHDPLRLQAAAHAMRTELAAYIGHEIHLTITNNRSSLLSLKIPAPGRLHLRMHHLFLDAPKEVRKALAEWIRHPRGKKTAAVIDLYIKQRQDAIAPAPPRRHTLRTQGRHHDLARIFAEVNTAEFSNTVECRITWGKMPAARRRGSIRFGTYTPGDNLIRIHPLLDQEFVPAYFIRYIVFHEMLHAAMGIETCENGRRAIHPPAFRRRECAYHDYDRALAWMEDPKNLRRLLSRPKTPR